jgi:hypothetical protein
VHSNRATRRHQQNAIKAKAHALHGYELFNLLTAPELLSAVERHAPAHRERLYTPTVTLSLFMAQTLNPDASCQAAVNRHAVERVANGLPACSTSTGAYCRARQRLPVTMITPLVIATGRAMAAAAAPAWRWKDRRVKLVDGTTVSMPDTPENQARYPQSRGQKPGLGFPIARVVALLCLASGAAINAAIGPCIGKAGSEHALLRAIIESVEAGDIILADRYYCAYCLIALLRARGADVVFQQHQSRLTDFAQGTPLGARDHIVEWTKPIKRPDWLDQASYDALPATQRVREVHVNSKVLVTTLLSTKQASKRELGTLYTRRWNVELDLRNIKTTLGLDTLRCLTPDMCAKELWSGLLAYNLIKWLMMQAANQAGILPRQIGFKHTVQMWLAWLYRRPDDDQDSVLLVLIAEHRVGKRPGRIEPRAVKRRPKPFPLLTKPRPAARAQVRQHGHAKKLK